VSSGNFARVTPDHNSFANIPDGMAGIETMIPVVFSEGVRNSHLSLRGVSLQTCIRYQTRCGT
jgi:dihydroorotase-like cyclic amidohydrolase